MQCKLRKIGNSIGVILPAGELIGYNIGDEIVITLGDVITNKSECVRKQRAELKGITVRPEKTQSHSPMMVGYVPPKP